MVLGIVIGHATATMKHPSLVGLRMPLVQVLDSNRKPEGGPVGRGRSDSAPATGQIVHPQQRRQRRHGNTSATRKAPHAGMSWGLGDQ